METDELVAVTPVTIAQTEGASVSGSNSWGLDRINQDLLPLDGDDLNDCYVTSNGANARVYVLDTGVRTTHDVFTGRTVSSIPVPNSNLGITTGNDVNGHGTHVRL